MPKTTSRAKAEAHERLTLRLTAALAQLAAIAARHPEAAVPDTTRVLAEALLYDARQYCRGITSPSGGELGPKEPPGLTRGVRGPCRALSRVKGFPAAAHTSAALASQLAEVKAALEMWEAEHSFWDGQCFVWGLTRTGGAPSGLSHREAGSYPPPVHPC